MKNDDAKVMFARGGLKVYKDKAAPYIMRENNVLGFGDELIGDGHTLDFMVKNPFSGRPCRAALIGFLDGASGDLAGYDIMLTENTQVIASALRNAIIYMGKYPKIVHLDNGRAFKSKASLTSSYACTYVAPIRWDFPHIFILELSSSHRHW